MMYNLSPLGDQAVVIEVDTEISQLAKKNVKSIVACLNAANPPWMIEYIPAYTTVTISYAVELDSCETPYDFVCSEINQLLANVKEVSNSHREIVRIPVLYGGEHGPDLDFVAAHNGLTTEEVITIHTSGEYTVHMIGFAPGFPFIGGMSEKIAAPRRETPRLEIPARTVGIAGMQTGVYPIASPGGWQLIGRTPIELFLPTEDPPSLLTAGDRIRFYEITPEQYKEMRGDVE
ncbi:5-oxoprolinase subunit PxpB [Sporosarcina sp. Sa2YVA2]|uniref:5-oxoprolinase subunit PxpB n=1 Tax=Sporosarcina quadrami TaxID=2762234 RepID=A0ABR8U722_9BACL|nr:5-oxoprolinase subunit PxpB [Sporosarcina quadrami]MBD7983829.1 5-oxoprolinase subunit PxpB [Sporosarcina quadrami]